MRIDIRGDVKAITKDLTHLQRRVIVPAQTAALNKTAKQVRTRAIRATSKELNIKQRLIRGRLGKLRRATYRNGRAAFFAHLAKMPARIIKLKTTRRNGWKHKQHHYDEAFAARVPRGLKSTGGVGVFQRRLQARSAGGRDAKGRLRRGRLPIEQVRINVGPTLERHTDRYVMRWSGPVFRRNFERELSWRLSRL